MSRTGHKKREAPRRREIRQFVERRRQRIALEATKQLQRWQSGGRAKPGDPGRI